MSVAPRSPARPGRTLVPRLASLACSAAPVRPHSSRSPQSKATATALCLCLSPCTACISRPGALYTIRPALGTPFPRSNSRAGSGPSLKNPSGHARWHPSLAFATRPREYRSRVLPGPGSEIFENCFAKGNQMSFPFQTSRSFGEREERTDGRTSLDRPLSLRLSCVELRAGAPGSTRTRTGAHARAHTHRAEPRDGTGRDEDRRTHLTQVVQGTS